MALDIFGNTLYTGDVVVYADVEIGSEETVLTVYEVDEVVDKDVVLAMAMSGDDVGLPFYLQETDRRCSLIRNVYKTAELKFKSTMH